MKPWQTMLLQYMRPSAAAQWWLSGGIAPGNCVAAYQPKGAADLAASYVNLANPGTYDCTIPVASPTLDGVLGWQHNGTTQYLDTGLVETTGSSWLVRFSGLTDGNYYVIGAKSTTATVSACRPSANVGSAYIYVGGTVTVAAGGILAGVIGIAGANAYINGVNVGTGTTGRSTRTMYLGGYNYSTVVPFLGNIQAAALYSTALTPDQMVAVTSAMAAL